MLWLVAPLGAIAFVDTGGLIAYGPSYANLARRGASYVDRILRGIRPADLRSNSRPSSNC